LYQGYGHLAKAKLHSVVTMALILEKGQLKTRLGIAKVGMA
jgi:hypothetical protein